MRIEQIIFKEGESIPTSKLTVFVGPNSSGKTLVLREILKLGISDLNPPQILSKVVVKKIQNLDNELLTAARIAPKRVMNQSTDQVFGIWYDLKTGLEFEWHVDNVRENPPLLEHSQLPTNIKAMQFAFLDGETRLAISNQVVSHNPQVEAPENILQALFVDESDAETTLSESIKNVFGVEVRLDYSGMNSLCLRIAPSFNSIEKDPRKAFVQFQNTAMLQSEGTGLRSYVASLLSILLFSSRIILLDEPELYLHPIHQRTLGLWIGNFAKTFDCQLFLSTHSPYLLSGLLSSYEDTTVVRLQRNKKETNVKTLAPSSILKLVTSPLLSSQRVSESLFQNGVILCEADSDRLIYQAVADKHFGEHQHQFLFAHNKQSIPQVGALLNEAAVPFSVIVDLDILQEESELISVIRVMRPIGSNLLTRLKSLRSSLAESINEASDEEIEARLKTNLCALSKQLEDGSLTGLLNIKRAMKRFSKSTSKWSKVKELGIVGFGDDLKSTIEELISLLAQIGIFCVPVGELECWADLNIRKQYWSPEMLKLVAEGKAPDHLIDFVRRAITATGSNSSTSIHPKYDPARDRMTSKRPGMLGMYAQ